MQGLAFHPQCRKKKKEYRILPDLKELINSWIRKKEGSSNEGSLGRDREKKCEGQEDTEP